MKCKVRMYHLELVEAKQIGTPGIDYCVETKWEKVDDSPFRKVNVYWDETMYISSNLKDRVLADLENICYLQYITEETVAIAEKQINHILLQLFDSGNLSTRPGNGEQLILTKDSMYEYY